MPHGYTWLVTLDGVDTARATANLVVVVES